MSEIEFITKAAPRWDIWEKATPEEKAKMIFRDLSVEEGIEVVRLIRLYLQERLQEEINEQSDAQLKHQEKLNELHQRAQKLSHLSQIL